MFIPINQAPALTPPSPSFSFIKRPSGCNHSDPSQCLLPNLPPQNIQPPPPPSSFVNIAEITSSTSSKTDEISSSSIFTMPPTTQKISSALAMSSSSTQAVNTDLFQSTATVLALLAGRSFSGYFTTTVQTSSLTSSSLTSSGLASSSLALTTQDDPLGFGNQISDSSKNKTTSLNSYISSLTTISSAQETSNSKNTSSVNEIQIQAMADNKNSQNDANDNKYLGFLSLASIPMIAVGAFYKLKHQRPDRNNDDDLTELLDKIKKLTNEQQQIVKNKLEDILKGITEPEDLNIDDLKIKADLVYIKDVLDKMNSMSTISIVVEENNLDQENQHQDISNNSAPAIPSSTTRPTLSEPSSSMKINSM